MYEWRHVMGVRYVGFFLGVWGEGYQRYYTLTYQNLLFFRFPINSTLGIIIGPYKKVAFGKLR